MTTTQFKVGTLLQESIGSRREICFETGTSTIHSPEGNLTFHGTAEIVKVQRGVLVSAKLTVLNVSMACSGCLTEFVKEIKIEFQEEYLPIFDPNTNRPIPADEDVFRINNRMILDIAEAVRQYTETAIPLAPKCREICAGICIFCGKDLNQSTCACDSSELDNQFGPLKEYFK